jgi:hypothetical protein
LELMRSKALGLAHPDAALVIARTLLEETNHSQPAVELDTTPLS